VVAEQDIKNRQKCQGTTLVVPNRYEEKNSALAAEEMHLVENALPLGLKPFLFGNTCGTTEVVP
jgi:hypothetical protein